MGDERRTEWEEDNEIDKEGKENGEETRNRMEEMKKKKKS